MRVACRQGCRVGAGSRRRNVGRASTLRWAGAIGRVGRGGRDSTMPAGIAAPTPACAVGAHPPPRCECSRPTALAADTAGAAPNLGVFYTAVACRRAPRSITPASGAAEASRWAVPQPQRGPAMRVVRRQGCRVGAGSRRRSVGRTPSLRWAGAVGRVGRGGQDSVRLPVSPRPRAHGRWAPARRPAANPAAQPRSQQTPLARPQTWAFFRAPSRAVARLASANLPAALLKLALGGPSTRAFPGHTFGAPPGPPCGPDRAAGAWEAS